MQLNMLNVSDSLNITESNPTIGAVIPKLKTRTIEINFISGLFIIEVNAKESNIQLKVPKMVWNSTIAEKLARNAYK
jgi:hypothetical protein